MLWAIRKILIACCVFIGFGSEPVMIWKSVEKK